MEIYPKKLMLLGSGELGKEVTICAKRIGCYVIACDRYENAPAMQVADVSEVLDMNDKQMLKSIVRNHKPDLIIPEIEALATEVLEEFEKNGIIVIPNARATSITMNRNQIRELASNQLGIKTANFKYAGNSSELITNAKLVGFPNVIKPLMSSSGKGQSLVNKPEDLEDAWKKAIEEARGGSGKVIIEEYIHFDQEITLLTIRQKNGETLFCPPIGHKQKNGDYQCSWQPAQINNLQLEQAQSMAKKITNNLGGVGLFGVEFFITKTEVIFSELSPRPHDTGLVTLISQDLSEFELHLRAILGLPLPSTIKANTSASQVILADNQFSSVSYSGLNEALKDSDTKLFIFGKPSSKKGRRMGVTLAKGKTIEEALEKSKNAAKAIKIINGQN